MRSGIIIALLSTLLYWGQAVPAPQHHQAGLPQHGMFPRVQTVYYRPPPGFFFFPSWESLMSHVEAPNTNTRERDNLVRKAPEPTRVEFTDSQVEVEHISPGYDGINNYARRTEEEKTFVARPGKHVLLQFLAENFELEDGEDGVCFDWVKANGAEYCGDTLPDPILSDDKIMTVGFHSDKSVEKKGFKANVYEVSKVEEDSQVDMFTTWGPGFKISFDLMILNRANGLRSIFAFLGGHLPNVPQIRLNDNKLIFSTSYNPLTGEETVRFEKDVEISKWMNIVIESELQSDNTYDFVITVDGVVEKKHEDFPAKTIQNVKAFDSHKILQSADAVYKDLKITPTDQPTETPLTGQAQRGFLIAGGRSGGQRIKSAEVFNPVTGKSCPVGDLTLARYRASPSTCNNMICGGPGSGRSCDMFDGSSSFTRLPVTLEEDRRNHLCWGLKSGEVILLGGETSTKTTERVSADGSSSSADFSLSYDTKNSCGIDLGDYFVVTGGSPATDTVTRYSETGFDQDLPKLKQRRGVHACTKFVDGSGKTALLVTGGYDGSARLSSTEIYLESTSTWSFAAALPSGRSHLSAATLDNSVFVFGGLNDSRLETKEILSYDSTSDSWDVAGQMTEPRHHHGLGLHIDVSKVCP